MGRKVLYLINRFTQSAGCNIDGTKALSKLTTKYQCFPFMQTIHQYLCGDASLFSHAETGLSHNVDSDTRKMCVQLSHPLFHTIFRMLRLRSKSYLPHTFG